MAVSEECRLKRAMDQEAGIATLLHRRVTDMPRTALRTLSVPRSERAWRTELMVPRRAYKAEFTRCSRLAAMTASFSIRSPSLEKETFSPVRVAIKRVRIAGNGGSSAIAPSAFRFRSVGVETVFG